MAADTLQLAAVVARKHPRESVDEVVRNRQ